MKKYVICLMTVVFALSAVFTACKKDKENKDIPVTGVTLDKEALTLDVGATETLIATVLPAEATNKAVTWTSSNTDVATVSSTGLITAKVEGTSTITVTTLDGENTATCTLMVRDTNTVKDIDGNIYSIVKVGSQTWMSENLRVTQYDTKSERAGVVLTTSETAIITPYYVNSTRALQEYYKQEPSVNVSKFGYLYNWAAAVGLADGSTQQTEFVGKRQGICPNGWHLPTEEEYRILLNTIGESSATKLKSTYGWSGNNGTNSVGMSMLPAGYGIGSGVHYIGIYTFFWTATPARHLFIYVNQANASIYNEYKGRAACIRCVKDN